MKPSRFCLLFGLVLLVSTAGFAQANGNLQVHFMNVGQGDGAVLISPLGEVVLFDNGVRNLCDRPVSYLQQLGMTKVDYHIASHYHDDHIGCTKEVLDEFPLQKQAIDRGGSYHTGTYTKYVTKVGSKRKAATDGMTITLDQGSQNPVTIQIVAFNGNGVQTSNENDLSLVAVVRFGNFDVEIGGDLSGYAEGSYEDIETSVAPKVGQVEVYKVHHHGSRYSTNDSWLATVRPRIGIISAGAGNKHNHPTQECMERLHQGGIRTYWTEIGNGTDPEPGLDVVGGNIIVEVVPGAQNFTVTHSGAVVHTYPMWGSTDTGPVATPGFSWSKKSSVYHHTSCRYVANISPANLEQGSNPPVGKTLHAGCPK
jgi:beta-lactamase superfamily II metal-dependent hydrolase